MNSTFDEFGVAYFEGGEGAPPQLFFASTRGSGAFHIYVADQNADGTFGPPVLLTELVSEGIELSPAVRHDGLELFYASNRAGGNGGHDIWVSTRESVFDAWAEPVNAGPGVNTGMDELYPTITPDNRVLLFYRGVLGAPALPLTMWGSIRARVHVLDVLPAR